jgi:hypothetical protein
MKIQINRSTICFPERVSPYGNTCIVGALYSGKIWIELKKKNMFGAEKQFENVSVSHDWKETMQDCNGEQAVGVTDGK